MVCLKGGLPQGRSAIGLVCHEGGLPFVWSAQGCYCHPGNRRFCVCVCDHGNRRLLRSNVGSNLAQYVSLELMAQAGMGRVCLECGDAHEVSRRGLCKDCCRARMQKGGRAKVPKGFGAPGMQRLASARRLACMDCGKTNTVSRRGLCTECGLTRMREGGRGVKRPVSSMGSSHTDISKTHWWSVKGGKCKAWKARLQRSTPDMVAPDITIRHLAEELLAIRRRKQEGKVILTTNPVLGHGWFESPDRIKDGVSVQIRDVSDALAVHSTKMVREDTFRIVLGIRVTQSRRGTSQELADALEVGIDEYVSAVEEMNCGCGAYRCVVPRDGVVTAVELASTLFPVTAPLIRCHPFFCPPLVSFPLASLPSLEVASKSPCSHSGQVACELEQRGVITVKDPDASPLLTGSKKGLMYLQKFERVSARTIAALRDELLPNYTTIQVQTLLCLYAKYVRAYNYGLGRWYKKSSRHAWMAFHG